MKPTDNMDTNFIHKQNNFFTIQQDKLNCPLNIVVYGQNMCNPTNSFYNSFCVEVTIWSTYANLNADFIEKVKY